MSGVPTQRLEAVELAVERFERAEMELIERIKADPQAALQFADRIKEATGYGTRLFWVALGIRFNAQHAAIDPQHKWGDVLEHAA